MLAPRENPHLIGHEAAQDEFAEAWASHRLHHAWLITGPEGVGKATLAYRFARLLFSGGAAPNDPATPLFRRVAKASHADLLTVQQEWDEKRKRHRTDIVVDNVREIAGFMHLTPAEGGWRVIVVDGAEHLNRNAANALLKVLEEPPPRAVLLVTCAAPGRLLPTIRSRCRRLPLAPLAAAEMEQVLGLILPEQDADARAVLARLAQGSPGRAAALAEGGGVAIAGLVSDVLQAAPRLPVTRAYDIADRLARGEQGYATFMELLRDRLGQAIRAWVRGEADAEQARLASARPLAEWGEVWHALGRLHDETERSNLDKRHAIVSGLDLLNSHG